MSAPDVCCPFPKVKTELQIPANFESHLIAMDEIAVGPDKVSLMYRKCLYEMCHAKAEGPAALKAYLNTERDNI